MLKSVWFLAVLGVILGIGTTVGVMILNKEAIFTTVKTAAPRLPEPANAPRDWVLRSAEIEKLATDLRQEKAALEDRRKELDQSESRLTSEREELRKVRSEIDLMRREVTDNIPKVQTAERQNVKNLAKTYAAMKPVDAVTVLRELDDQTIVKILSCMKADVVGAIFQEMTRARDNDGTLAARAAQLSDRLRLVQTEPKPPSQP
jgi:flagellar motility protein MotE (MotC chaperone)